MATIAVFNQRAGVGKTTTALNLLAAIGQRGQRPWGIDLDPQAHLSRTFGAYSETTDESMHAFFTGDVPLTHVAHITRSSVVVCPAHPELADLDVRLGKGLSVVTRLRRALRQPGTATGPVIIDCPASFGCLALNAVFAADLVLVPVSCDPAAVAGALAIDRALNALEKAVKEPLRRKYVLTRFEPTHDSSRAAEQSLAAQVRAEDLLETCIRTSVAISESAAAGRDVFRHAPESSGAQDYQDLRLELDELGAFA
ncbi:MAG: ParA family protein [Casimicrobiaceae bacterium]